MDKSNAEKDTARNDPVSNSITTTYRNRWGHSTIHLHRYKCNKWNCYIIPKHSKRYEHHRLKMGYKSMIWLLRGEYCTVLSTVSSLSLIPNTIQIGKTVKYTLDMLCLPYKSIDLSKCSASNKECPISQTTKNCSFYNNTCHSSSYSGFWYPEIETYMYIRV